MSKSWQDDHIVSFWPHCDCPYSKPNMMRIKVGEIVEVLNTSWGLLVFLKTFGIAPSNELLKMRLSANLEYEYCLPTKKDTDMHVAILSIMQCYPGTDEGLTFETPHLYHSFILYGELPRSCRNSGDYFIEDHDRLLFNTPKYTQDRDYITSAPVCAPAHAQMCTHAHTHSPHTLIPSPAPTHTHTHAHTHTHTHTRTHTRTHTHTDTHIQTYTDTHTHTHTHNHTHTYAHTHTL